MTTAVSPESAIRPVIAALTVSGQTSAVQRLVRLCRVKQVLFSDWFGTPLMSRECLCAIGSTHTIVDVCHLSRTTQTLGRRRFGSLWARHCAPVASYFALCSCILSATACSEISRVMVRAH